MIFKKPYGFLIKNFKLIHLILTGLYIYLAVKVSSILDYYNNFISDTASKLDAVSYITSEYIYVIVVSILICIIIYILMRYKKKPRALYLILIGFYIIVGILINYIYGGLEVIASSVLESKILLLQRDFLRIVIIFQYLSIAVVLVRGLGFDIKKFNFVRDLQELGIDVLDDEEVELTLGGTESYSRKFHRNLRELKYYYFENKMFINLAILAVVVIFVGSLFVNNEIINKVYSEGEVFSTNKFQFQILNTYVTKRNNFNELIKRDETSFVIVKMNLGSLGEKIEFNTGNLILKVGNDNYSVSKRYSSNFIDIGKVYKGDKLGGMSTYLFIYNVEDEKINERMQLVYAGDKTVNLIPVDLDKNSGEKKVSLGDAIDLTESSFREGSLIIKSINIKNSFTYPYQYEIDGEVFTNEMIISSTRNNILHLVMESSYPYGLSNYEFFEQYVTLKYKDDNGEHQSLVMSDKTPGNYKEGLYLAVDKNVISAKEIWLEIRIRNYKYVYKLR